MSKKVFTASNGIEVSREKYGTVVVRDCLTDTFLVMDDLKYEALREYALHERDEELGLWRDPEDPTKVVYPILGGSNTVYVLNEVTGWSNVWVRTKEPGSYFDPTALRYFEEHPEPEPKPWLDAEPGEVWLLTTGDGLDTPGIYHEPMGVHEGMDPMPPYFATPYGDLYRDAACITAGHRIWPEGNDD